MCAFVNFTKRHTEMQTNGRIHFSMHFSTQHVSICSTICTHLSKMCPLFYYFNVYVWLYYIHRRVKEQKCLTALCQIRLCTFCSLVSPLSTFCVSPPWVENPRRNEGVMRTKETSTLQTFVSA